MALRHGIRLKFSLIRTALKLLFIQLAFHLKLLPKIQIKLLLQLKMERQRIAKSTLELGLNKTLKESYLKQEIGLMEPVEALQVKRLIYLQV